MYRMISVGFAFFRNARICSRSRFWSLLISISFLVCALTTFIHVPGTYGQTSLILQPINPYTAGYFPEGIPSFPNFFIRPNKAQLSHYSLLQSYQPSIAFFNGPSVPESLNIQSFFPSESFLVFSPNLRSISFDRSNVFSVQGLYPSISANNNNSLNLFLPNRASAPQFYYPPNFSAFPSGNTRNLGYNAFFSPFTSFFSGYGALSPYRPINANPTNWSRAEILVPTTSAPIYYTYTIVNIYPHDRTAFTQGLVYEDGFLYEGTGISGRSTLRKIDLLTGDILQIIDLSSQYFGEGITIYGNKIIQLTWRNNVGFVYDKFTFELLQEFYYLTEGWGITHNGRNLIMSDGTSTLHFFDPVTFTETGKIEVYDKDGPVLFLNELEFIQGEIYANVLPTNRIARISPTTGRVLGWIDLTGLLSAEDIVFPSDVLNGIAYDPELDRLLVTGKLWPKLFEIDLVSR